MAFLFLSEFPSITVALRREASAGPPQGFPVAFAWRFVHHSRSARPSSEAAGVSHCSTGLLLLRIPIKVAGRHSNSENEDTNPNPHGVHPSLLAGYCRAKLNKITLSASDGRQSGIFQPPSGFTDQPVFACIIFSLTNKHTPKPIPCKYSQCQGATFSIQL